MTLSAHALVNHRNMRLQAGPGGEDLPAVLAGVAVVLDALVDDLDVPVQVTFFAEYFVALRARGRLVNLDVEMNLFNVPVKSALFAEHVGAVRADDTNNLVLFSHVSWQVITLLFTLGAMQRLKIYNVRLQSV